MSDLGSPEDTASNHHRGVRNPVTDMINRMGSAVSAVLDAYMNVAYKQAWRISGILNRYGLHVRRYQMYIILALTAPAVVAGVLGYIAGRLWRR